MNVDDICLNIDTSAALPRAKKQKSSKLERLKQKRQQRKTDTAEHVVQKQRSDQRRPNDCVADVSATVSFRVTDNRKRKNTSDVHRDDDVPGKRPKFSSLFTNNPEIPWVDSVDVKSVSEVVFTNSNFSSATFHPFMVSNLEKMGYTVMTSVQQLSVPAVLGGGDVLIQSQTGSGKTLSYAIPVVERLQSLVPKVQRSDGPYCIVVVPTRELALQTYETFQKLVQPFLNIVPGCIMGGEKKKSEKARLRRGINVLVSTPGRLVDHIANTKSLRLNHVRHLVIDEADRLLEMGFEKDISTVVSALDECSAGCQRQTILLSATLTPGVEQLAGMSLENPTRLDATQQLKDTESSTASRRCEEFAVPDSLVHHFVIVPSKLRLVTLAAFLMWKCRLDRSRSKVIVFLFTQDSVEFHYLLLSECLRINNAADTPVDTRLQLFKLHGDLPQKERTKIFQKFHSVNCGVLLCTDVAARGLDVPHVHWIVQYNTPGKPTDYIHRVGRTARIGVTGSALIFLTPAEVDYVKVLRQHKININEMNIDVILKALLSCDLIHKGERARTAQDCAAFLHASFERHVATTKEFRSLARKAFQSFVRAYATYPSDLKRIFHVRNLHLGHVAKSFALVETPSKISKLVGRQVGHVTPDDRSSSQRKPAKQMLNKTSHRVTHLDPMSEFASGLD